MGKFKPHKGLLKRVRITKRGKVKMPKPNRSHLRSQRTPEALRRSRKAGYAQATGVTQRMSLILGRRIRSTTALKHEDAAMAARKADEAKGSAKAE